MKCSMLGEINGFHFVFSLSKSSGAGLGGGDFPMPPPHIAAMGLAQAAIAQQVIHPFLILHCI